MKPEDIRRFLTIPCVSCGRTYEPILGSTVVKDGTWGFRCPNCYPPSKAEQSKVPTEYILDQFFVVMGSSESFKPKGEEHNAR